MGKISTTGSAGGGYMSDECTARLSDVPAGLKAVTADSRDEAGVGTMALTGNAQAGHVLAGETFYTNDYKTRQTGTLQTMAGKTITPGGSQQSAGCAGKYMSGDIIVPGFAMPAANQIKKGTSINIYGRTVVGTFEGYVPTPTDLYLRGANIVNFQSSDATYLTLESGCIRCSLRYGYGANIKSANAFNFSRSNTLHIVGRSTINGATYKFRVHINGVNITSTQITKNWSNSVDDSLDIDISVYKMTGNLMIEFANYYSDDSQLMIYRIFCD